MKVEKNYLQEKTIKEFYQCYNYPTLMQVSTLTGIQHTRVFRLSNGAKMKLEEYEVFKDLITRKLSKESNFAELIIKFEAIASRSSINQISNVLRRNIKVWELKNKFNQLA